MNFYLLLGKVVAQNGAFGNSIIFLQQFFPVRGGGLNPPNPPAYATGPCIMIIAEVEEFGFGETMKILILGLTLEWTWLVTVPFKKFSGVAKATREDWYAARNWKLSRPIPVSEKFYIFTVLERDVSESCVPIHNFCCLSNQDLSKTCKLPSYYHLNCFLWMCTLSLPCDWDVFSKIVLENENLYRFPGG